MTTQVHLQLNDQLVDRLRELAAREKRSLTNMCEVLLDDALAGRVAMGTAPKPKAAVGKRLTYGGSATT